MPGAGSGQSLRRLRHWSIERGPDRTRDEHHGRADPPARALVVEFWLARLSEHPCVSLSPAQVDRQTGTPCVGRPRDAHVDANDQASQ